MTAMVSTLAISVAIYAVGLWFCRSAPDYREELLTEPLAAREARPGSAPALAHCAAAGVRIISCFVGVAAWLHCRCSP